ncbi:uncharacterized protein LOC116144231 isoform X2 [Pistacia vera]|uniref:uncharacterized protein LOC116144231 isoform X2 n=1 Tax=Pistacia vera TaxID=55513 RepID=UPI001262C51F|nr:uncharacterized protein LOC116144231 isoform X2 [Pistacia vera]
MSSKHQEGEPPSPSPSYSPSSSSDGWKERIFIPTVLAGIAGAGYGLISNHRKVHGLANISSTYATNFSIVTACYCGAREFVRASRKTGPDDLLNSAIAGFGSGTLLGRLQGGQAGAIRYSLIFAVVGTTMDYATLKLKPLLRNFQESQKKGDWLTLPDWSPIQVLDEEALAEKQAQEQKLFAQRALGKLNKEKS